MNTSEEKHAIVTGGSRGIGRAIVVRLLKDGYRVWYLSRTIAEQAEDLASIAEQYQQSVTWIACDIADRTSLEQAMKVVMEQTGWVDLLVNNAGITRDALIMRMKDEAWDHVLQVNLSAAFITCRSLSRHMVQRRQGCIINISSVVGLVGNPGQTNYAASKAGLIGFSKSLARELASRAVRVNVVAPGFIETSMTEALGEHAKTQLQNQIPLGRIGSAYEVADAVAYLASPAASYITGQVLAVDGGMTM